jgi:hypothetical protein
MDGFPNIEPEPTSYAATKADSITCPECSGNAGLLPESGGIGLIFCRDCRIGAAVLMKMANYGTEWERVREYILSRDERTCQNCNKREELHVHHIEKLIWFETTAEANQPDNLIALCSDCHEEFEDEPERVYDHLMKR